MQIIGLTGGIASGKSTAADMFRALGAPVVDADLIAREVVKPGSEALAEIRARFGEEVTSPDGRLDRKALGALVFADPKARRDLNSIVHPKISEASAKAFSALERDGNPIALYEAALIVENGLQENLDGLIVVAIPPELQAKRLQERDAIDKAEALTRLQAQSSLEDKLKAADYVLDNSGTQGDLRRQVAQLWQRLSEHARFR